ncbi:MAG: TonB-dependent receptor [Acidobacteria bacterium]|nr:TonB-dependent receptor [Acidobacteriota bacterium]
MHDTTKSVVAAALFGCLGLLWAIPAGAQARTAGTAAAAPAVAPSGSIDGIVRDGRGAPLPGVMVSAVGASAAFALTGRDGRFVLAALEPGVYVLRAHRSGFAAGRGEIVEVAAGVRASSTIALNRTPMAHPILEAGLGLQIPHAAEGDTEAGAAAPAPAPDASSPRPDGDRDEMAWRLRHARRGVLQEVSMPEAVLADGGPSDLGSAARLIATPVRRATSFFADMPFSGQFNLLTAGSFETPAQLFTLDSFARSIADVSVGAPAGGQADWSVRGALTQGDVSSWIVAGAYATRAPARRLREIGLSYSAQRYNAGNPGAFHEVDGGRNAGVLYAFETVALSPALALTYGARYGRYDYLTNRNVLSPRFAVAWTPARALRINTLVSRRATAPGAEEFVPPAGEGLWQPTQRTFSPLLGGPLRSERTTHAQAEVERDLGRSTFVVRAFAQQVAGQLVTVFGAAVPGRPVSSLGHYFVGADGSADAVGWATGLRTELAGRVHASVEYAQIRARWTPEADLSYLIVVEPSVPAEATRIHRISTAIEADVPETSTRVLLLYRVSNGFAHAPADAAAGERRFDTRFDVQVRQSLPFMDFSSARWEMLVAVRNFFREMADDQSVYDELLVVRPPKRIVGGLTLHF